MKPRRGTAIESANDDDRGELGSNRVFGWLMAIVSALVAAFTWRHGYAGWLWITTTVIAIVFAITATLAPARLQPLNRFWMAFGHLLGRIVSPAIMALIYFGVVTPIALIARARGVDPMRRKYDPDAKSYWIERDPPGPDPMTMERQF